MLVPAHRMHVPTNAQNTRSQALESRLRYSPCTGTYGTWTSGGAITTVGIPAEGVQTMLCFLVHLGSSKVCTISSPVFLFDTVPETCTDCASSQYYGT
jgi:hypothetical protein